MIQINVIETGNYIITSKSTIGLYGYIYNNTFNPTNPNKDLLQKNIVTDFYYRFKLVQFLDVNKTYILVVSAKAPNFTANFSVISSGPNNVVFNRIGKHNQYKI